MTTSFSIRAEGPTGSVAHARGPTCVSKPLGRMILDVEMRIRRETVDGFWHDS